MLFNDKQEKYGKWCKLLEDPVFEHKFDVPLSAMRDRAYAQIKRVHDEKLFSIFDFDNDPKNIYLWDVRGLNSANRAQEATGHHGRRGAHGLASQAALPCQRGRRDGMRSRRNLD